MKNQPLYFLNFFFLLILFSCSPKESSSTSIDKAIGLKTNSTLSAKTGQPKDTVAFILQQCIKAHGGDLYENAHYSFTFRGKKYQFSNSGKNYEYQMKGVVKEQRVKDQMVNGEFSRFINGKKSELNEKELAKYSESLNSVIYFATLPHKLKDEAVNKSYQGQLEIKGQNYHVLKVTFNQDGGGKDFEDEYYYWINTTSYEIDYLAYNYQVNGGGIRFRSAYNKRVISGITFQDYINYKANVGTPLKELPKLFEKGQLEELSKIETEEIIHIE